MDPATQRTPAEWFAAAELWYLEGHQGCINCGDRHCVFRSETEALIEFYCYSCDFSVCRQLATGRHYVWGAGKVKSQPWSIMEQALLEID
jgi:hypothetical protein